MEDKDLLFEDKGEVELRLGDKRLEDIIDSVRLLGLIILFNPPCIP